MSDTDKIKLLGGNTGNIVFDYALGTILNGEDVYTSASAEQLAQYDRFVTTSYIWIRENEPINTMFSEVGDKPLVPMSVGLQADYYKSDFALHPSVLNELKSISERCVLGCRGNYTAEILNRYGIKNLMVIGCPSVYINMFDDWNVERKGLSDNSKTTANFMTFWRALKKHEQNFLLYAFENNMDFIEQTSGKLNKSYIEFENGVKNQIIEWSKLGRIFYSYKEWSEYIKQYDFSMGFRFHGNVAALNNNVPALFIYSDSRVRELCDYFKLPAISSREFDDSRSLEYWYEKADYSEFNRTHKKRIEDLRYFCHKNGLTLKDEDENKTMNYLKESSKIEIKTDVGMEFSEKTESFELVPPWEAIKVENKTVFLSDGKTVWKHLKIRLPEKLVANGKYRISLNVMALTDNDYVRYYLCNENGDKQLLCSVQNDKSNEFVEISEQVICEKEYEYIAVTSTDFIGENFFSILDIKIDYLAKDVSKYKIKGKQFNIPSNEFDMDVITNKTLLGYSTDIIKFEVPVFLGYGTHGVRKMGAYSYYGNGFEAKFCESIGRFCIIGENVTVSLHNHCFEALTAHPIYYYIDSRFSNHYIPTNNDARNSNAKYYVTNSKLHNKKVIIGNDVWIGDNVTILNGVYIGDGAIVGAGSVVTKNVEPYSIVCGNPAKEIRKRCTDKQICELLKIRWWDYGPEILDGIYLGDIDSAISKIKTRIIKGYPKYKAPCWVLNTETNELIKESV